MSPPILVLAEHTEGRLRPLTWELLACARELQGQGAGDIHALVVGREAESLAEALAKRSGTRTIAITAKGLGHYQGDAFLEILLPYLSGQAFSHLLLGHSPRGWDLAPALSAALGAVCIPGVERVLAHAGRPGFQRSLYGGKRKAQVFPLSEPVLLTIQPGCFDGALPVTPRPGSVERREADLKPGPLTFLGTRISEGFGDTALTRADVIVAAGKGIGKREALALLEALASRFPRSAVAGSRPVCDLGWLPIGQQVGQTGQSVSPRLYVACGISGASQHVYGMKGAGLVVAINKDPHAAIFDVSDVCVVEDLVEFLPALIRAIDARS